MEKEENCLIEIDFREINLQCAYESFLNEVISRNFCQNAVKSITLTVYCGRKSFIKRYHDFYGKINISPSNQCY